MNAHVAQRRGRYDAVFYGALGAVTGRRERPGPGGIICTYEPRSTTPWPTTGSGHTADLVARPGWQR